jgi:hypothetical protein
MESQVLLRGVRYRLENDGTASVVGFTRPTDIVGPFPMAVNVNGREYVVTRFSGFEGWNGLKVVIPRTAEYIGEKCFRECKSLTEVIFESD